MRRKISLFVSLLMIFGGMAGAVLALDPLNDQDADADPDRDNLSNAEEYVYATDPNDPDTDGAGCYDGWEVWYDYHRAVKVNSGTPIISDDYHFDPNDGSDEGVVDNLMILLQVRDADANRWTNDPDNDGWNNLHEFLVGSDPTNPNTDGDVYPDDSTDPNPLVSDGTDHEQDWEDDHPGNGGGGSGEGEGLAALMA